MDQPLQRRYEFAADEDPDTSVIAVKPHQAFLPFTRGPPSAHLASGVTFDGLRRERSGLPCSATSVPRKLPPRWSRATE
jgi:hypothetical protein